MERTRNKGNGTPLSALTAAKLQVLTSTLTRANLASLVGQQYGGDRDVYKALGYPTEISFDEYEARYLRQDIARAVINRPISFTWKGPLVITEVGTNEETPLEKEWKILERQLQLKNKFVRLDKLSSIGSYGVLLLGFDDVTKQENFALPVREGKRKLLYARPLTEDHAKVSDYVKNTKDPRYGLVEFYEITLTQPGTETTSSFKAHYSRVIHVAPDLMENDVEGEPVLKAVWNRLMDLEKLVGGSAEMFWRGARPGYQGIVNEDYTLPAAVEAGLQDQLDEFEHNLRRLFVNEGIKLESLEPQVSDPANHVDVQIQMISAITGIPKRVLTGSERGELSSSQDITSWLSVIQTRREEYVESCIVRPFVDKMIQYKILPAPTTDEYQVAWQDLFASSDKDQAEVGRIRATAIKEYSQNPMAEMIVPPEAFLSLMLGLDENQIAYVNQTLESGMAEEQMEMIKELAAITKPPAQPSKGTEGTGSKEEQ